MASEILRAIRTLQGAKVAVAVTMSLLGGGRTGTSLKILGIGKKGDGPEVFYHSFPGLPNFQSAYNNLHIDESLATGDVKEDFEADLDAMNTDVHKRRGDRALHPLDIIKMRDYAGIHLVAMDKIGDKEGRRASDTALIKFFTSPESGATHLRDIFKKDGDWTSPKIGEALLSFLKQPANNSAVMGKSRIDFRETSKDDSVTHVELSFQLIPEDKSSLAADDLFGTPKKFPSPPEVIKIGLTIPNKPIEAIEQYITDKILTK